MGAVRPDTSRLRACSIDTSGYVPREMTFALLPGVPPQDQSLSFETACPPR